MAQDWKELTELTRGADLEVERVRIKGNRVAIEGSFDLPPLARLTLKANSPRHNFMLGNK